MATRDLPFELAVVAWPWAQAGLAVEYHPAFGNHDAVVVGRRWDAADERVIRFNAAQRRAVGSALVRLPWTDVAVHECSDASNAIFGDSPYEAEMRVRWVYRDARESPYGYERISKALLRACPHGLPRPFPRAELRVWATWLGLI